MQATQAGEQLSYFLLANGDTGTSSVTLAMAHLSLWQRRAFVGYASCMRLYRYRTGKSVYYGEQKDESTLYRCVRPAADRFELKRAGPVDQLSEVELLPPTVPSKVICVGRNYGAHAAELGNVAPEESPLLFFKAPSSLIAHEAAIAIPPGTQRVDYEGEIALVIACRCREVPVAGAFDYLLGVTAFNDVTARDWQQQETQWARAKSCDTFGPCGPFIDTTAAEALRAGGAERTPLAVTTYLNSEQVQHGDISELSFSLEFLISHVSQYMTLEAGDLIATGTPAGVGPLSAGDEVVVELSCGPRLLNRVAHQTGKP